jgi:hypothetical protein
MLNSTFCLNVLFGKSIIISINNDIYTQKVWHPHVFSILYLPNILNSSSLILVAHQRTPPMRFNQLPIFLCSFVPKTIFQNYMQFSSSYTSSIRLPATTTSVRTSPNLLSLHTLFLCDLNRLRDGSSARSCKVNKLARYSYMNLNNHIFSYF